MASQYEFLYEFTGQYRRFNAQGSQHTVFLNPPSGDNKIDPITHFESGMGPLFEYALNIVGDGNMVCLPIRNDGMENQQTYKPTGFSFRRKVQLSRNVIWRLFEKATQ
jgi:hypothetical protein